MTSAQVVETSVTNNSSFQNYPHPDDHTIRTNVQYYYAINNIGHRSRVKMSTVTYMFLLHNNIVHAILFNLKKF